MKQALILFATVFLFVSCSNDAKVKSETKADSTAAATRDEPAHPYSPSYTSKFEIGDPAHSKTILDLTKIWDDNALDSALGHFADSITLYLADGTVLQGAKESVTGGIKPYRNSLGTVSTKVHAWTPLKAADKDENWVVLWFTEYRTAANGKKDSAEIQETWRLNKEGKADMLMQYERKNPPAKK